MLSLSLSLSLSGKPVYMHIDCRLIDTRWAIFTIDPVDSNSLQEDHQQDGYRGGIGVKQLYHVDTTLQRQPVNRSVCQSIHPNSHQSIN